MTTKEERITNLTRLYEDKQIPLDTLGEFLSEIDHLPGVVEVIDYIEQEEQESHQHYTDLQRQFDRR